MNCSSCRRPYPENGKCACGHACSLAEVKAFVETWLASQREVSPQQFIDLGYRLALRMAKWHTRFLHEADVGPPGFIPPRFASGPIDYQAGRYRFSHPLIQDYFTARGIWDTLNHPPSEVHLIEERQLEPYYILRDVNVVTFLRECAENQSLAGLLAWINHTRQDRSDITAKGAACAATVLNGLGKRFAEYDFRQVRIPGADLRMGCLNGAQFQEADLAEAQLSGAQFSGAQFQGADLTKAKFGQKPWFSFPSGIDAIAYHPTQPWVALGQGNNIVIWDLSTQRARGEPLRGHTSGVTCVAFSPDGRQLVSGSWDNTLRRWDGVSGAALGEPLRGHIFPVTCVAFSPDGRQLVSGSWDETLRRWDGVSGAALGEPLRGHTHWVTCVAFSPEGRQLVSGSGDKTLRRWDGVSGAALGEPLRGHTSGVTCVAFSPEGGQLVSGSHDNTLRRWDGVSGAALGEPLRGHTERVTCVAFSPEGRQLVSGSGDKTLRRWDGVSGAALGEPLRGHTNWVTCVAFSPDGRQLVSGSWDKTLRRWDGVSGAALGEPLRGHTERVTCVAFSPEGRQLVSGSEDWTLRRWDGVSGAALGEPLRGHTHWVTCVAFSPDGRQLVSGSWDNTLRRWDGVSGAALGEPLRGHTDTVTCVAFSPEGRQLVSGSFDNTLRRWDGVSGAALGEPLRGHTVWVSCVAFSPDGRQLVSGSWDKTLRRWDVVSGAALGEPLRGHTNWLTCVAFSPEGRQLVSGSHDKTLRRWDGVSGEALGEPLHGHTSYVTCVAFSPEGRQLVSGSADSLRFWDTTSGQCLQSFLGAYTAVVFSPNGEWVIAGRGDGLLDYFKQQRTPQGIRYALYSSQMHYWLRAESADLTQARGLSANKQTLLQKNLGAQGALASPIALPAPDVQVLPAFLETWSAEVQRFLTYHPDFPETPNWRRFFEGFCSRLLQAMASARCTEVAYQFVDPIDRPWIIFSRDRSPAFKQLQRRCPVQLKEGRFRFRHPAWITYFSALVMLEVFTLNESQFQFLIALPNIGAALTAEAHRRAPADHPERRHPHFGLVWLAEQNHPAAQFFLGTRYETGQWNFPLSEQEALTWFQRAAEGLHPEGLYKMALFWKRQNDFLQAYYAFSLSHQLGYAAAKAELELLKRSVSPEQQMKLTQLGGEILSWATENGPNWRLTAGEHYSDIPKLAIKHLVYQLRNKGGAEKRIELLGLSACNLDSSHVDALVDALKQHQLSIQELDLSRNKIETQGAKILFPVIGTHILRRLDCSYNLIFQEPRESPEYRLEFSQLLPEHPVQVIISYNYFAPDWATLFPPNRLLSRTGTAFFPSRIAPNQMIQRDNWVVFLFRNKKEGDSQHAMLLMESLEEDGQLCIRMLDFRPSQQNRSFGVVKIAYWDPVKIVREIQNYVGQAYPINRAQGRELLDKAERDKAREIHYSKLGKGGAASSSSSVVSYNCLTWAQHILKDIGLEVKTSWLPIPSLVLNREERGSCSIH